MNTALSTSHSDEAFFRDRKAMLMYPLIVLPFITALFFILGGGKAERRLAEEAAASKAGAAGFNASVPTAKNGSIDGRDVETPGYGKAAVGQMLSKFTHTSKDSTSKGLQAMPVNNTGSATTSTHASSLAATPTQSTGMQGIAYQPTTRTTRRGKRINGGQPAGYYYNAPGSTAYPTATDQQLASQMRNYESTRQVTPTYTSASANQVTGGTISPNRVGEDTKPATVQLSDNLTATRLDEPMNMSDAFNTAPTSGSRRQSERAVLTGGGSYGSKKTVAWMIPVVVHEDQTFKSGNTVKLRLTKEITADGITIPVNTILHAVCQTSEDRLRMVVQNVQLSGQLIPLDLEVYDIDGLAGVNMPGLSNQSGGQLKASAIQGLQVPGLGGLANTVASQARMNASNSLRQTTVRLKAGYHLYLKAQ